MRKINYYSLALLSALTVFGCSENDLFEASQNPNNAISFSTQAGKHSRGVVVDNTTNNSFLLYGCYTGQEEFSSATSPTFNFMKDQEVKYSDDGTWSYDPLKYWPNTTGDKISFFGMMPILAKTATDGSAAATISESTAPAIDFTQATAADKMVDFVVAQKTDQLKQTEAVVLPFKHILTRLNFAAKVDKDLTAAATQVFVTGLRVLGTSDNNGVSAADASGANDASRFYSSATYTLTGKSGDAADAGSWNTTNDSPTGTVTKVDKPLELTSTILNTTEASFYGYTTSSVALAQNPSTSTALLKPSRVEEEANKAAEYLFLIPPYGKEGIKSEKDIRVQLDYDIVTKDSKLDKGYSITSTSATISLPNGSLKESVAYNIAFTIGLTDIKVAANVSDWEEEKVDAPFATVTIGDNASVNEASSLILSGLKSLNATKAINNNSNYFTLNIDGTVPANTEIKSVEDDAEKSLYDLSFDAFNAILGNFEVGDQIEIKSETNSNITMNLPTGWEWYSKSSILKKVKNLVVFKKSSYYQWDAYSPYDKGYYVGYDEKNETQGHDVSWGPRTEACHLGENVIASVSCKDCLTKEQLRVYVNNEPYWDDAITEVGTIQTYYSYKCDDNGNITTPEKLVPYHTGVWLMKYAKCNKSKTKSIYPSGKTYNTGLTDDIRTGGDYFFLPAAGRSNLGSFYDAGTNGRYWSSTPYVNDRAYYLYFYPSTIGVVSVSRYNGCLLAVFE